ncbi:MAG: conjugative transposon protein TraM [Sphingobacterium sp.]
MEKMETTPKIKKLRKFLLVAPLLVLPFITIAFWGMGGGKGHVATLKDPTSGLNDQLPGAQLEEKELDKMGFYEKARKDSLDHLEQQKNDPYYLTQENERDLQGYNPDFNPYANSQMAYGGEYSNNEYEDPNTQQIYEKINALNAALDESNTAAQQERKSDEYSSDGVDLPIGDIERLEQMMLRMQETPEEDPEMDQINSVLGSILDIQHPERVQERIRQQSQENQGQVYAVTSYRKSVPISLLENRSVAEYTEEANTQVHAKPMNAFYSLENPLKNAKEQNAIPAVVHESQTVVNGARVKLRLTQPIFVNGQQIPKDVFVFGTASLRGERLEIAIEHVRKGNSLYPVQLEVFDMDGMPGIHIPGAINRDVAKQGGEQALQGSGLGSFSNSIGAQAASAGIEIGSNLLRRKIKLVKVELKAGYQVLLKDEKRRD